MVGAKVCELTDGFLWFVCGLYVGILMSSLTEGEVTSANSTRKHQPKGSVAAVAIPWFLSDLENQHRGIRGLEPGAVFCLTP